MKAYLGKTKRLYAETVQCLSAEANHPVYYIEDLGYASPKLMGFLSPNVQAAITNQGALVHLDSASLEIPDSYSRADIIEIADKVEELTGKELPITVGFYSYTEWVKRGGPTSHVDDANVIAYYDDSKNLISKLLLFRVGETARSNLLINVINSELKESIGKICGVSGIITTSYLQEGLTNAT